MRTYRRFVGLLGGAALIIGAVSSLATPAGAAPSPTATVSGAAAPVGGTSADITVTYTVTVAGGPVDGSVLTATDPTGLQADPSSVRVDGAAAPAGTVDPTPTGLVIRAGTGASPAAGGQLTDGAHTISYTGGATTLRSGATVSASFSFGPAGSTTVSQSGAVDVALPDLVVKTPPDSGEDETLPLAPGEDGLFAVLVSDTGAPADAATLTITLPTGLRIDPDFGVINASDENGDGVPLDCTDKDAHTVTCVLGKVDSDEQLIGIAVQATSAGPVGTVGRFTVSAAADSGLEANPADNSVSGAVEFAGASHLVVKLHAAPTHVVVGHSTKVAVSVSNTGPDAAAAVLGFLGVLDSLDSDSSTHFEVTGFTGDQLPIDSSDSGLLTSESGSGSARAVSSAVRAMRAIRARSARTTASARTAKAPPFVIWDVDTVPAGGSVKATLTLKAVKAGHAVVVATAFSLDDLFSDCDPDDPSCDDGDDGIDTVSLTAVAPAPPVTHSPAGGAANPVADTGVPTGRLTLLGLLTVLAGAMLLWIGMGVRPGRHRV